MRYGDLSIAKEAIGDFEGVDDATPKQNLYEKLFSMAKD